MIQMRLSTALRMLEPEIRHTTGAQPTRMIKFHVRTKERTTDRPSWEPWDTGMWRLRCSINIPN